jgi:hypothetical protein
MKQKQLYFSSKYADVLRGPGDNETAHFQSNIYQHLEITDNEKARVAIRSVQIPMAFHQVSAHRGNSTFTFILEAGPDVSYDVQVADGTYTADELINAINDRFIDHLGNGGIAGAIEGAYNTINNKFYFLNTTAHRGYFTFAYETRSRYLLGFEVGPSEFLMPAGALGIASPLAVNLIPIDSIYIHSNLPFVHTYSNRENGLSTVMEVVPALGLGDVGNYSISTIDVASDMTSDKITNIQFWVTDDEGRMLDLKGQHWSVNLVVAVSDVK